MKFSTVSSLFLASAFALAEAKELIRARKLQSTCLPGQSDITQAADGGFECMDQRFGSQTVCTANDVSIATVSVLGLRDIDGNLIPQVGGKYTCVEGDDIFVDFDAALYSQSQRYDIAIFWGIGGSAKTGNKTCSYTTFSNSVLDNFDFDGCGDLQYGKSADVCGLKIKCSDASGVAGKVSVGSCVAWDNRAENVKPFCNKTDPQTFTPNTKSKCNCGFTTFDINILKCNLAVSASGTCLAGVNQGKISLTATATSSFPPITYSWSGPNGATGTGATLTGVAQGAWTVSVTDALNCTAQTSVTVQNCCRFAATCNVNPATVEGCGAGDLPGALNPPANAFSVTGSCGTPKYSVSAGTTQGSVCDAGGLTKTYTYTVFDDLDNDNVFDNGVELKLECTQTVAVKDTRAPTITSAPDSKTEQCPGCVVYSTVPSLNACFTAIQTADNNCLLPTNAVTFTDAKTSAGCSTKAGVYTRTWTVTDQCDRTATASRTVTIVDTTAPVISCPAITNYDCTSALGGVPSISPANDACDGAIVPSYKNCCFKGTAGTSLTLDRTWTATDSCGNKAECTQSNPMGQCVPPLAV